MAHTTPPLRIGCDKRTGTGYGKPPVFWREKGEVVEVRVESDCYVKFKDRKVFDVDGPYRQGQTPTWKPLVRKDTTAGYDVTCSKRNSKEATHSIKIGSGRQTARKAKPKTKTTKAKKGRPRKAKVKKKTG